MNTLLLFSCVSTTIIVIGALVTGVLSGKYEVMSFRTFFLGGFLFFYPIPTLLTMSASTASNDARMTLAIGMPLFAILALAMLSIGNKFGGVDRVVPKLRLNPCFPALIALIGTLLSLGLFAALLTRGGFGAAYLAEVKTGLSTAAVGLAAYLFLSRKLNPLTAGIFVTVFVFALVISTVGSSGRRGMLNVILVVPWMWYFVSLRYQPLPIAMGKLGLAGVAAFALVTGYSGIRHADDSGSNFQSRSQQFQDIARGEGINRKVARRQFQQDTPDNTMFIIDNYPASYPHNPLHGPIYYLVNPIPRFFFPDKPIALGITIMEQRGTAANLAPGILGHGWYEAAWIGIAYYAVIFGLAIGAVDALIRRRVYSPFFLAVIPVSLGNVFGLARGETALFAAQVTAETVGAFIIVLVTGIVAKSFFDAIAPIYPASWLREWEAEEEAYAGSADHPDECGEDARTDRALA